MFEFILAPENFPFATSLAVMLLIAALEGVAALFGLGFSWVFDRISPGVDGDFDIDGADFDSHGPVGKVLSWLTLRRVPVLVLLIIFLLLFGFTGLLVQDCAQALFGFLLPASGASALTFVITLPLVRGTTSILSKIIPQDETTAISLDSLIGKTAEITLGLAKRGYPSQAKARDRFGKVHYFMIEPDEQEDIFYKGEIVLLVKHDGVRFFAIRPNNRHLA